MPQQQPAATAVDAQKWLHFSYCFVLWQMAASSSGLFSFNHSPHSIFFCCLWKTFYQRQHSLNHWRLKTFFYSIELRKCGVCRQRKSSGARRKTECSWWPCMKNWFSSWNSMLPWGQGWAFLPWNKPKACWRAKMPTPARRAAYCWLRKTSAECKATKCWRYFSIAKELSLSKYTSFAWFYWIRDFVTLQKHRFPDC